MKLLIVVQASRLPKQEQPGRLHHKESERNGFPFRRHSEVQGVAMEFGRGRRRSSLRIPVDHLHRLMDRTADEFIAAGRGPSQSQWIKWVGFHGILHLTHPDGTMTKCAMPVCAVSDDAVVVLHGFRLRVGDQVSMRFLTKPRMRRDLSGRIAQCRLVDANVYAVLIRFTNIGGGTRLVENCIHETASR